MGVVSAAIQPMRVFLDAKPLQDAIKRDAARIMAEVGHGPSLQKNGLERLGTRIGIESRILRRVITQDRVELDVADAYCCRTGRHLSHLYPEVYDDDYGLEHVELARMWLEGYSHGDIARRLGMTYHHARWIRRYLNLPDRTRRISAGTPHRWE